MEMKELDHDWRGRYQAQLQGTIVPSLFDLATNE
jgi:hypothetical protein